MFVDRVKLHVKAGKGGDGIVAFRREKYVAYGGPSGGDGGNGGNVVFMVDEGRTTLLDLRYQKKVLAENGGNGKTKKMHGASGNDMIVKVPQGTIVKDAKTGRMIADLTRHGQKEIIARGGKGGRGNFHFKSSKNTAPQYSELGAPGEEFDIQVELKVLADVGLVGFPSVGKSSLISVVSQAKPKIADYHFTTIVPNLGVVYMGEGNSFVMADIPGLIEGAGDGVGLGHEFLKHVDRCRLLIHIVDVSGSEGRNPIEDFEIINKELAKFDEELAKRPMIVAGNKIDMAEPEQIEEFKKYVNDKGYDFYPICAPILEGTKELMNAVWQKLSELPPIKEYEAEEIPMEAFVKDDNAFKITKVDDGYFLVEADWFPKVLKGVNIDDYESLQYMQRVLEKTGVFDALREQGCEEGDIVSLYDIEFEFVE